MESNMKQFLFKRGLVIGGILSAFVLIQYVVNKDLMLNWWLNVLLPFVAIILALVFSAREYRLKYNDGFIEFKEAFSVAFGTIALASLVSTAVQMFLYNVIDPGLIDFMVDGTITSTIELMESFGTPQEGIDQALANMEDMEKGFMPIGLIKNYFGGLIFWAIISLIIAAASKKARPLFDDTLD